MLGWWLGCQNAPPAVAPQRDPVERPVTGGNLLARADGGFVAADTERNLVWFGHVDGGQLSLDRSVALPVGSWPVRLAEAPDGAVWVTLRAAGQVARIDDDLDLIDVCAGPHGVWADADGVAVACSDGELVTLDPDGDERARVYVAPDLRDVVRVDGAWWVSTFRSAELWIAKGEDREVRHPPEVTTTPTRRSAVAWRLRADPAHGGVVMSHQRARADLVDLTVLGVPAYGTDFCESAVEPAVTRFFPDGTAETTSPMRKSVLPVDLLPEADGTVWLASAGADGLSDVGVGWIGDANFGAGAECATAPGYPWSAVTLGAGGRVTAVEAVAGGRLIAMQGPFGLALADDTAVLDRWWSSEVVERGVHLFHAAPLGALACASCHPEGREDGQVWQFGTASGVQVRRTQSLAGGLAAHTAPLHWDGTLDDLDALLVDTFEVRMGATLYDGDMDAFAAFLGAIPPVPSGPGSAEGEAVFGAAGCAACHAPPWYTDGANHDVGTGESLQTPSLVGVSVRGPWMHDGCAATLEDRFDPACGGTAHGSPMDPEDQAALIAWLSGL